MNASTEHTKEYRQAVPEYTALRGGTMERKHDENGEIVTLHIKGRNPQQYKKVYEGGGGVSYERLMSPEERELTNQRIVSEVVKMLNESRLQKSEKNQ